MFRTIRFKIDDDIFEAHSQVSVKRTMAVFFQTEMISSSGNVREIEKITNKLLKPRSRKVFNARMRDMENPINCTTVIAVIRWLWEQYGGRPTVPSPDSFFGQLSRDDGKKLMVKFYIPELAYMLANLTNFLTSSITQSLSDWITERVRILARNWIGNSQLIHGKIHSLLIHNPQWSL